MADTNWTRSYLVVLVLSIVLIPVSTLCATAIVGSTMQECAWQRIELAVLPQSMASYWPWGIVGTGAGCLAVIGALWVRRRKIDAVLIGGVLLAFCQFFMLAAMACGHVPFTRIITGPGQ